MGIVVGIDIGGSTTKIAGFQGKDMLIPVQISANNAIASLFGAFGKFLYDNKLALEDIQQVNLTGVGCSAVDQAIYGLPTYRVDEFTANGVGGGYFAQGKVFVISTPATFTLLGAFPLSAHAASLCDTPYGTIVSTMHSASVIVNRFFFIVNRTSLYSSVCLCLFCP